MSTSEKPNPHLALVGMHGPPEITGLALRESLIQHPIDGWDVAVANELAVAQGVRYVKKNLAMAFPGDLNGDHYEDRRAAQLSGLATGRRTVLEVHDRPHTTGEYVVIGDAYIGDPLAVAARLGIKHVLYSPSRRLVNHSLATIAVEMCRDEKGNPDAQIAVNVRRLRECMGAIAAGTLPKADNEAFEFYMFAEGVHGSRARALGLEPDDACMPLSPVPRYILKKLGLPLAHDYVFEGWNGSGSSQGEWFGEIFRRFRPKKVVNLIQDGEKPEL